VGHRFPRAWAGIRTIINLIRGLKPGLSFVRRYVVDLSIPAEELLRYYRGTASSVVAYDQYNRRLQFPAAGLRPFVTSAGVHGRFVLEVDRDNRLRSLNLA
jgi:hypothetical protein